MDYRYFPDPDLLPLEITEAAIARVKASMPELPQAMCARFETQYQLPAYDAATLTANHALADYFEAAVKAFGGEAKTVSNWVMGDLLGRLHESDMSADAAPVTPRMLGDLLKRIADGTISGKIAKEVFATLWSDGGTPDAVIEAKCLKQISDSGAIQKIITEVLAANPKSVEEFRAGKEKAFNALVGQAMKASRGTANPAQVNEILRRMLAG